MGTRSDNPEYLTPYEDAVREHGPSFRATLWASRDSQQARFRVIAETVDLTGKVVVDAGCATGDLAKYLVEGGIEYGRYVGIDGVAALLDEARTRNFPRAEFVLGDFVSNPDAGRDVLGSLERTDVIVFSGSLNTLEQERALGVLERAWPAANDALVFNFLSSRDGSGRTADRDPTDPARRFDPLAMLDWAMARTPCVRFRQDYLRGHDATIAMYR